MKVIFVGHDASRTGAPVALLELLRSVRSGLAGPTDHTEVELVLLRGGELEPDYCAQVPTVRLDESILGRATAGAASLSSSSGIASTLAHRGVGRYARRRAGRHDAADVVVANTLASLSTAAAVARADARLVAHVHELDHVAERILPPGGARRSLLGRVDRFVAAGAPVGRMLVDRMGVAAGRVSVVAPSVDVITPAAREAVVALRRTWGPSPVVAAIGATSRRKGADRFGDVMRSLANGLEDAGGVRGVWLGATPSSVVTDELHHDVDRLGLVGVVDVRPPGDAAAVAAAADVVVSTAREDPFPLALLEAAASGTPVVAFDAGGFAAVLRGAGCDDQLLPVGDVLGMSEVVRGLLEEPAEVARRGAALQDHVRRHHAPERVLPHLWNVITGAAS